MSNIYCAMPAKVLEIEKHTSIEWSFLLEKRLEEEPGKFIMVSAPGAGEVPISISGFSPSGIEITIREAGKVTSQIFKTKQNGHLYIRGPYGNAFPMERFFGKHLLIIAGGSGIAAIKPIIEYYHGPNGCPLKKLDLLVGFKSPKHILFRQKLKMWSSKAKGCDVRVTVDTTRDEDEVWLGGIGFVVSFIKEVKDIGRETHAIIVGPPLMMTNSVRELLGCSVKPENIWLSFERHMKCGLGKCGHCRIRDKYVCIDGPVFNYEEAKELID